MAMMNESLIQPNESVAKVLEKWPNTTKLFLKYGTACVGCYLARFCTLEDAINTYRLDRLAFLDDLEKYQPTQINAKGALNEKNQ